VFGQEQLRRQEETDSDQENEESRSDEESEEHRKMPPKTDERQLPDEATPEQIAAYRKTLQKERTVAKREYTRRKNILDKMLGDASGRPEFKELAELAMQELTLQYNLVSNRNHDLEMNSTEDELDAFMDTVNDGYKETQLAFIRWKLAAEAGQPDDPPARRPNEAVYSVIGLNFDIRKTIREKFSMIRRKFSEEMGLQGPATSLNISVAGGSALPPTMEKRVKLKLQSIDGSYMSPKLEGITAEKITRDLRPVEINTNDFEHLKGIDFTETYPRAEKEVDILIGVDHYTSLMKGEIIRGQPQEPTAIATKLGFVLSGSA
jgi:hypothetical protein